jgi:hypothetical protein
VAGELSCLHRRRSVRRPRRAGQLAAGETTGATFERTARSLIPRALNHILRTPVVTARGLADKLSITSQAALGLVRQLVAAGVLREATGRTAWRAFATL